MTDDVAADDSHRRACNPGGRRAVTRGRRARPRRARARGATARPLRSLAASRQVSGPKRRVAAPLAAGQLDTVTAGPRQPSSCSRRDAEDIAEVPGAEITVRFEGQRRSHAQARALGRSEVFVPNSARRGSCTRRGVARKQLAPRSRSCSTPRPGACSRARASWLCRCERLSPRPPLAIGSAEANTASSRLPAWSPGRMCGRTLRTVSVVVRQRRWIVPWMLGNRSGIAWIASITVLELPRRSSRRARPPRSSRELSGSRPARVAAGPASFTIRKQSSALTFVPGDRSVWIFVVLA